MLFGVACAAFNKARESLPANFSVRLQYVGLTFWYWCCV